MKDRLERIKKRYEEINRELSDPHIANDIEKMKDLGKERHELERTVTLYEELQEVDKTIDELRELVKDEDEDIREMAQGELTEVKERRDALVAKLERELIPKDPNDEKDVIVEIRGAAGGDEANIFAADLFRMYLKFAESKNWEVNVAGAVESDAGGFSQIEFTVSGDKVYSQLKYESGAHRVQRVPKTESQGRIHTSTATVVVLPEAEDVEVELDMNDVRVDTYRSSGAGGQHVNKTDSAVRLTHEPTGVTVSCQEGKSQHENKEKALKILRARLHDIEETKRREEEGEERRSKIGTGDRSEKVRTYNFPQNRVTDHRINFTVHELDKVMEGRLDPIITALIDEEYKRKLETA